MSMTTPWISVKKRMPPTSTARKIHKVEIYVEPDKKWQQKGYIAYGYFIGDILQEWRVDGGNSAVTVKWWRPIGPSPYQKGAVRES